MTAADASSKVIPLEGQPRMTVISVEIASGTWQ